jgi:hypothetical protein
MAVFAQEVSWPGLTKDEEGSWVRTMVTLSINYTPAFPRMELLTTSIRNTRPVFLSTNVWSTDTDIFLAAARPKRRHRANAVDEPNL